MMKTPVKLRKLNIVSSCMYCSLLDFCEMKVEGGGGRMCNGRWPQDPYGGSLLILPNLYVMLAFIVSP
jgi:hypothetical protein